MAVRRKDLDELNRPPRPVRALPSLPMAAGAENITGNEDAEMGGKTVGDILLEQVDAIGVKLDEVVKNQLEQKGQVTRELDALRRDVADLKSWRAHMEELPAEREARKQRQEAVWWQTTNGRINIATVVLVIATTVAPFIAAHWH